MTRVCIPGAALFLLIMLSGCVGPYYAVDEPYPVGGVVPYPGIYAPVPYALPYPAYGYGYPHHRQSIHHRTVLVPAYRSYPHLHRSHFDRHLHGSGYADHHRYRRQKPLPRYGYERKPVQDHRQRQHLQSPQRSWSRGAGAHHGGQRRFEASDRHRAEPGRSSRQLQCFGRRC